MEIKQYFAPNRRITPTNLGTEALENLARSQEGLANSGERTAEAWVQAARRFGSLGTETAQMLKQIGELKRQDIEALKGLNPPAEADRNRGIQVRSGGGGKSSDFLGKLNQGLNRDARAAQAQQDRADRIDAANEIAGSAARLFGGAPDGKLVDVDQATGAAQPGSSTDVPGADTGNLYLGDGGVGGATRGGTLQAPDEDYSGGATGDPSNPVAGQYDVSGGGSFDPNLTAAQAPDIQQDISGFTSATGVGGGTWWDTIKQSVAGVFSGSVPSADDSGLGLALGTGDQAGQSIPIPPPAVPAAAPTGSGIGPDEPYVQPADTQPQAPNETQTIDTSTLPQNEAGQGLNSLAQ